MSQKTLLEMPELKPKPNRHIVIALNHLEKRLLILLGKQAAIQKEIDEVKAALAALIP